MIQSETGTSDVHFEKGGGVGHGGGNLGDGLGGAEGGGADAGEESKIKGLVALEAADGVSRQLAASDCSSGPCGGGDSNKASLTASTASNLKGIFFILANNFPICHGRFAICKNSNILAKNRHSQKK